jgi:hypothetical protein
MAIRTQGTSGGLSLMPQSRWGWGSVGLAAAFGVFAALTWLSVALRLGSGGDFEPAIVIPMGLAGISATAALLVGIASIIWRRERSILVFLSAALGLVITAFWVGQIVMAVWIGAQPHTPPPPPPPPPV